MNSILQPWQLLVLILAGWINRQQQEIIQGTLANLGHKISGTTVGNILERAWDRTGSGVQAAYIPFVPDPRFHRTISTIALAITG